MDFITELEKILKAKKNSQASGSYTTKLLQGDRDRILKKIGEEAGEVIIAAKNDRQELIHESADLIFHLILLLVREGVKWSEISQELEKRHQVKTQPLTGYPK